MRFVKLFCLLICLVGCGGDYSSNNLSDVPMGAEFKLPQNWEAIERIDSCTFYVKDLSKDLCFIWAECMHNGHGPQTLIPCEKLEKGESK